VSERRNRFLHAMDAAMENEPAEATPAAAPAPPRRGPGRPRGKRSNPDYVQISAYVLFDLYEDFKLLLQLENRGRKASDKEISAKISEWMDYYVEERRHVEERRRRYPDVWTPEKRD
jgi:hypothetical protein